MTSNQRRRNQCRQLAHLKRNWPDIYRQVAAEVGQVDDLDKRQRAISFALFKAAGWRLVVADHVVYYDPAVHDRPARRQWLGASYFRR